MLAAPANQQNQATVIKWKPDFTYDTLRKGTNALVCYDRSGQPGQPAFSIECTGIANLERVAQNMKFEAMADKKQAMLDAAEKDGTRVKPEYGSVFYNLSGAGPRARSIAYDCRDAGRHHAIDGIARQPQAGWRVDHECWHDNRSHHDPGPPYS